MATFKNQSNNSRKKSCQIVKWTTHIPTIDCSRFWPYSLAKSISAPVSTAKTQYKYKYFNSNPIFERANSEISLMAD